MKGHSERVPNKNLRMIAGVPLFHWILNSLLNTATIDEVVVDTDSDDIAKAVQDDFPEVTIHPRPEDLWGDLVPMHQIVAEFARSTSHQHILQTHATNPLLRSTTIDEAVEKYLAPGPHDSLMSVTQIQSRFFLTDGRPVNHDPAILLRTQDLAPLLEENSCIYISPTELILETGLRIGEKPLLFPMDRFESTDIDEEYDFRIAEFLLKLADE